MSYEYLAVAPSLLVLVLASVAPAPLKRRRVASAVLRRIAVFAALWWILTEGDIRSWPAGLAGSALAVGLSLRLLPPSGKRFVFTRVPHFLAFFSLSAMKSGVQVAAMALRPRLDLHPAIVEIDLRLSDGDARLFLASTLSLLPGTLSCGLDGSRLQLHVLDGRRSIEPQVRATEARVAALFRATP